MSHTIEGPTLVTSAIALLTITNPIGSLPIFLGLTKDFDEKRQKRIALLVGAAVVAVLVLSLVVGRYILEAFGIDITSFRIAGNLLVASIGWGMLTAKKNVLTADPTESPVVVPLAIPLIAGPGAISLVITFANGYTDVIDYVAGAAIVVVVGVVVATALFFAPYLAKAIRPTGMSILTRIFGLLLLSIALQSILAALGVAFPSLMH